jgi:hypothetical protein
VLAMMSPGPGTGNIRVCLVATAAPIPALALPLFFPRPAFGSVPPSGVNRQQRRDDVRQTKQCVCVCDKILGLLIILFFGLCEFLNYNFPIGSYSTITKEDCREYQSRLLRNRLSPRYINIATTRYNKLAGAAAQPSPKNKTREREKRNKCRHRQID